MADINVAVIYYSATGTTYDLARTIESAAKEAGAEVRFRKVKELAPEEAIQSNEGWGEHIRKTQDVEVASNDDLEWADAIIFGTPTRYGLPSAQLKQFIDGTGPLWGQGKLGNKVVSSFTTVATQHGGHETTIVALNNVFYSWGAIIVPSGYLDPIQFEAGNPYGTSFTSNNGQLDPDETANKAATYQAKRVVQIAGAVKRGMSQPA